MESYCLPLLTYALGALNLTSRQCNSLNFAGTVFTEEFGFHRWESVKCFICGLGKLNFLHYAYAVGVKVF